MWSLLGTVPDHDGDFRSDNTGQGKNNGSRDFDQIYVLSLD